MLKLVCISDTHMFEPELPDGDILIHAGDFTYRGRMHEIQQQLYWLGKHAKRYKHVIVIPGNHDFGFENEFVRYREEFKAKGIIVLNDNELIVEGVKFYGSPITPFFHNWAFNRHPEDIEFHWDIIPDDVQVLITHGPPHGILDGVPSRDAKVFIGYDQHYRPMYQKNPHVEHVGCPELLERIKQKKQLKVHIFGHIHEGYGQERHFDIDFINPSIMDGDYKPVNKAIVYELKI